jgi:hypothetical protein
VLGGADKLCHLHVPIVLKSWSLNLLEPPGPVKACSGIAYKNVVLGNWSSFYMILNIHLPSPLAFTNTRRFRKTSPSTSKYWVWGRQGQRNMTYENLLPDLTHTCVFYCKIACNQWRQNFFFAAQQPYSGLGLLYHIQLHTHTYTHPVGLLWTSD